jgi:peptidoglycan/LPS O-acetylase OafA/YrhL
MTPNHNVFLETAFVIIAIVTANVVGLLSYRLIERRSGKIGAARISWRRQRLSG